MTLFAVYLVSFPFYSLWFPSLSTHREEDLFIQDQKQLIRSLQVIVIQCKSKEAPVKMTFLLSLSLSALHCKEDWALHGSHVETTPSDSQEDPYACLDFNIQSNPVGLY